MKRRAFLSGAGTIAAACALPRLAVAQSGGPLSATDLNGASSSTDYGVSPGSSDDQSRAFQAMLDAASESSVPIFLPPGRYVLSGIRLPTRVHLRGVPDRTTLVYGGDGFLVRADGSDQIFLDGISVGGGNGGMQDGIEGLLDLRGVRRLDIVNCTVRDAFRNGMYAERCGGRIAQNTVTGAGQFAVFARDSAGLTLSGNTVSDCASGGIVVHRNTQGRDGTIVTGNRIERIAAAEGGTGQWGNAINLFRSDDVVVSGNIIVGSAFSAIRANTARGLQIIGNNCRESGETAIYAEFGFENAVVAENIVDGAANGISVTNFDHGGKAATVSGNIIRNLHATGPYEADFPGFGTGIGVEADTAVVGNMIEGAPLFGINAGWGRFLRDVVIASNVVRNARYGIGVSAADGAGSALLNGNIVRARETAIMAHAWGEPVGRDLGMSTREAPGNIVLTGNTATLI